MSYAYRNRSAFRANLQPFVETKKQIAATLGAAPDPGGTLPDASTGLYYVPWVPPLLNLPGQYADPPTNLQPLKHRGYFCSIVPNAFMYKQQGVAEDEMVGDSCHSRYLTTKLAIQFPNGDDQIVSPY